jgi:hypothetical protein
MKKKHSLIVSLTGGLGNQLFQLAAGLSLANNDELLICSAFGRPRKSNTGDPELLSFNLPYNVKVLNSIEAPKVISKIGGYLLRVGVEPRSYEKSKYFAYFVRRISKIPLGVFLRKNIHPIMSKGIGFSHIVIPKKDVLLFGYFQSFQWVERSEVKRNLMNITLKKSSETLDNFVKLSAAEKPLIVHIRLGDYLKESNFGIPSKDYYESGIKTIINLGKCESIWLFSDDMQQAKKILPDDIGLKVRYIDQVDDSTADTFEVMRLGFGYVIANSSFSWWAAYLSKNINAEVVSPVPWFAGLPEPVDLIPANWFRISSKHINY